MTLLEAIEAKLVYDSSDEDDDDDEDDNDDEPEDAGHVKTASKKRNKTDTQDKGESNIVRELLFIPGEKQNLENEG